jgi:muramoyltetrapeptide carboxypeptidase LdcA involved in peptidoglycan recycling
VYHSNYQQYKTNYFCIKPIPVGIFTAKPGDVCRIVAPCSPGATTIQQAVEYVNSLGLLAQVSEDIYNFTGPPGVEMFWWANSDEYRAADLASALLDDDVKIIWAIQGGLGPIRTIQLLDPLLPAIPPKPKLLIGTNPYHISK